ncbi:hsp90 co-chaperone Cdc37 [Blastocladiella emersonii ATCC 22665]|nr:hsp90 co-chaperone Cdc37 [Blastocladiella emersonii ATCC 22665]
MSRINYSKWDNIELSDDEDVEVHPNVDKKSFIRWRQQKIHQDRAEREHGIAQYTTQLAWLDEYLTILEAFPDPPKDTIDRAHAHLAKFANVPEQLQFTRVVNSPKAFAAFRDQVRAHRATLVKERQRLLDEDAKHLSVDKISKPGFDSTRVNSGKSAEPPKTAAAAASATGKAPAAAKGKATATTVEVLNPTAAAKGKAAHAKEAATAKRAPEDKYITSDDALAYANLDTSDYPAMYSFLRDHPHLVSSSVSDEILAAAFQCEMDGKPAKTKRYVHQSQVLSFCLKLGANGAPMFFSKIADPSHQASRMFRDECAATLAHIQKRSQVLRAKAKGQLVSSIDLEPKGNKMDVFRDLPTELQQALLTEDLDKVDAVLAAKSETERARLRKACVDAGILRDPDVKVADGELSVSEEEKLRLFKSLPAEFGEALLAGNLEHANVLLTGYDEAEAERVLDVCKRGGFLEFEEDDDEEEGEQQQSGIQEVAE